MEEKGFDIIFSQLQKHVENQLAGNDEFPKATTQSCNGGGTIPFEIDLDRNGNAHYQISKKGWGVTISATATIQEPGGAVFSINVRSSDGGGGDWSNIPTSGSVSCKLKTSFWHSTTITIDIHSSKPNCRLKAELRYSY